MQQLHLLCLSLLVLGRILDGKRGPLRLPFLQRKEGREFSFFCLLHFQQTFRGTCGWGSITALLHPLLVTCPTGTLSCPKSIQEPAGLWGWEGVFGTGHGAILPPSALAQFAHIGLGLPWSHSPQDTKGTFLSPCGVGQPGGKRQGWEPEGRCLLGQGPCLRGCWCWTWGLHRSQLSGWVTLEPLLCGGKLGGVQTPCGVAPHLAAGSYRHPWALPALSGISYEHSICWEGDSGSPLQGSTDRYVLQLSQE